MPVDIEYLRHHYASLSDEALLEIECAELVEAAQTCYDEEVRRREIQRAEVDGEPLVVSEKPDWLADAGEVLSRGDWPGRGPAPEIANARDVLEAAGIPCYLQCEERPEDNSVSPATRFWNLLVPGHLSQRATSVLDRDIFNEEFEGAWRTHLGMLSNEELRELTPEVAFCGLFDRVERVTRAYAEEIARRGLESESA